jgi:hypothetical protein
VPENARGSLGERPLPITAAKLGSDPRSETLTIPELAPTQCCELKMGDRVLHGTIHALAEK